MNFLKQGFARKMHAGPKSSQQLPPGRGRPGHGPGLGCHASQPPSTRGGAAQSAQNGQFRGLGTAAATSRGEAHLVSVHYRPPPHGPRKPDPALWPHGPPARRHLKCPVPQPVSPGKAGSWRPAQVCPRGRGSPDAPIPSVSTLSAQAHRHPNALLSGPRYPIPASAPSCLV